MKTISEEFTSWLSCRVEDIRQVTVPIPNLESISRVTGLVKFQDLHQKWLAMSGLDVSIQYVVCLAYTEYGHLVLIKKNRPEWQAKRYNGPGGVIKDSEGWMQAATREFQEETGVYYEDWDLLGTLEGPSSSGNYRVWFVTARSNVFAVAKKVTDEDVILCPVGSAIAGNIYSLVEPLRTFITFVSENKGMSRPLLKMET